LRKTTQLERNAGELTLLYQERYAWTIPRRWFDMQKDPVVLIGREFWDVIGGHEAYDAFIEAVNELGGYYKEIIYRDYLGIEPPQPPEGPFRVREGEGEEYEE
jgi:hypothetical protein